MASGWLPTNHSMILPTPRGTSVTMFNHKSWQDVHTQPDPPCAHSQAPHRGRGQPQLQGGRRNAKASGPGAPDGWRASGRERFLRRRWGADRLAESQGPRHWSAFTKYQLKSSFQESQDSHRRPLSPKGGSFGVWGPVLMYWSHTHEASAVCAHTTPLTPGKLLERMAHAHQIILSFLSHISTLYQASISKSGIDQACEALSLDSFEIYFRKTDSKIWTWD